MDKIKKIMKDNKYTVVAVILFVFLVILGYGVYSFLFPNIGSPVYGNRLDGIEKVEITTSQQKKLQESLKEKEYVNTVSSYIKGRIFNVVIEVKDKTSDKDAKALTTIIKDSLEEKQRAYFDLQVFIKNENEEAAGYPIIGYLNKEVEAFSYSQDE